MKFYIKIFITLLQISPTPTFKVSITNKPYVGIYIHISFGVGGVKLICFYGILPLSVM